jgi:predicted exporter
MARLAYGLLITLSLVTTCAAIIEALHIPLPGAVGIALLAAAAIEATLVSTFLSLRRRAEASLAQVDLLDGVAREATTLFRRQEARHSALKHEAAGHVQALRTGLRTGESPASQAPIPSPIATPALDDSQCL